MNARLSLALAACAITGAMAGPAPQPAADAPTTGVRVESTGPPWSGASKAGLRPGDVIFAWALPDTEPAGTHAVASLADWYEAEAEHGVREAGVVVSLVRDGQLTTAALRGGAWLLGAGPLLSDPRLSDHQRATELAARGEPAEAATLWGRLAENATQDPDASLGAWFWLRAAGAQMAARNPTAAVTAYGAARAAARERDQPLLEREALEGLSRAHQASQQPVAAEAALSDAVALLQTERPNSPALVRTLNGLAAAQREFGRLDESEHTYQRALDLARVVAPGSIAEVASLGGLSVTLRRRGDRAGAERLLGEAARVLERFPDHPDRIANAGNRGILLVEQSRLAEGERELRRAEALDRARGTPADGLALAHHGNLGVIAAQRGDFARAETYFRSFMAAADRTSMDPLDRVRALNNLAVIALERGDAGGALATLEAAHGLAERAAPDSIALADALSNLGSARARAGDTAGSDAAYRQALGIRRQLSPDEPGIAALLWSLASNAERRGQLGDAAELAAEAVAHIERTGPGSLSAARAYHVAARVALAEDRVDQARRLQAQGLALARDLAPGSRLEVSALVLTARLDAREGRLEAAAERYAEAVDALRFQVRRLGAPLDLEAGYIDDLDVQHPFVDTLLALGRHRDAFERIEAFRARAVLDRLATRDLTLGLDGDAADAARERRALAREYDATLAQLSRVSPATAADQVRALQARLREVRGRQAAVASRLRRLDAAPGTDIEAEPPSLDALQASLPAGAVALVYHLGVDRATVFAVTRDAWRAADLPGAPGAIEDLVGRWRRLVDRGRTPDADAIALDQASLELHTLLLAPVARELGHASRIVVVPDGALHGVAFAAIREPGASGRPGPYLVERTVLTTAPSLSTLARLRARAPRAAGALTVSAFGDVTLAADGDAATTTPGEATVRSGLVRGLAPLPGSRREAERVAALFAPRSRLHLGPAANETAVKRLPRDTGVLHLASHGILNAASPLDSALVLSPATDGEDEDNGLLQAWEVFEHVRIDADLVVLSACDTGLGRTFAGEGLLGLTRAFQFAGARAVAATLWTAPDEATARLMDTFYEALRLGRPADEALALAQRRMLAAGETSHPFAWAAFVLDGAAQ